MATTIRLWLVTETEKAWRYSKVPLDRFDDKTDCVWVPKSIVEHRTKRGAEHEVTLPDWFVEKAGL